MRILLILITVFISQFANAQMVSAQLKVNGLTCSLCSRSVEMALQKLDFVKSVSMDLETTQAEIQFREGSNAVVHELAEAVRKAGFSVAEVRITGVFKDGENISDACFAYQGQTFQLMQSNDKFQSVQPISFTLIGEEYMAKADYRKWKDILPVPCKEKDTLHYYVAL